MAKQTVNLSDENEAVALKIAAHFGCVSKAGPRAGEGSIQALMLAIVEGELLVVRNPSVAANGH